jgi:TPR repeat protein
MAEANDMRAINMLAIMYSRGAGVDRDIDKALEYAFRVDKDASTAHTQGFISMLYMMKTPSDASASYAWLKKATSTQVVPGLFFRLARYYEGGVGVAANQERAYVWYLMSMMSAEADMDKYKNQKLMAQTKVSELESALSDEKAEAAAKLAESCFSSRSEACY